jgi:ribonucleotide reductase alpha subunit
MFSPTTDQSLSLMSSLTTFHVVKRNGESEEVSFDKVIRRIRALCDGLSHEINPLLVAQKVVTQIYDGVKTTELDELAAQVCIALETTHLDYGKLASRIIISNNHKNTSPSFSETIYILYHNKDSNGVHCPLIADDVYQIIMNNKSKLNDVLDYQRDYLFDYFGFKTLEKAYLMKSGGKVIERIQHLIMRVSIGIHKEDIKSAIQSYQYMSQKYFTHATPTLYNAGTPRMQLSSCFLLHVGDSVDGLYKATSDMAKISANAGGIGICLSDIRSKGSYIRGVNGTSNGIIPYCRVLNEMSRHINQAGKRPGSIACYLEPHHPEVLQFLELRKNTGAEHERCRDLFTAMWISDLFMKRVEANEMWSFFDPDECPGLSDAYGDAYETLYMKYEAEGKAKGKQIEARKVWNAMLASQIETGTPYIGYKDHVNRKSNQKNVGTIKNSNLCVVPETKILTRYGEIEIAKLVDQEIEIWNGEEWSSVIIRETGRGQKIVKVLFENNKYIECTEYHKFHININGVPTILHAHELKPGMKTIDWHYYDATYKVSTHYDIVKEVVDEGRISDTYCFNEPLRHAGIFNGIITSQCIEITEVSTDDEYAVCNLASLSLPQFVVEKDGNPVFDYEKLVEVTKVAIRNLNKVIDVNYYPVPETKKSNSRMRPVGLGIQGLADVFAMMRLPFDSSEAREVNKKIAEAMYYGAVYSSWEIACDEGPYSEFKGSPMSQGQFQFDMWGVKPSATYDWDSLREKVIKDGVRNSLLIALMPTASTSQILGNNECFEPYTSNIYTRRTIAGDFVVINKHLVKDLMKLGIWNINMKNKIIAENGSVQKIDEIPVHIRNLYKTVWEIKQRVVMDLAIDRSPFVCQTSSMNLFFEEPSPSILTSAFMYGWKNGLKTGIYYLRTRPKVQPQQFTIEPGKVPGKKEDKQEEEGCAMCSA